MSYFKNVQFVPYQFGSLDDYAWYQNLGSYVDIIDKVKDNSSFYKKHTILDGDRPDVLSFKLYGTAEYYWTFFLMNDDLRKSGWPLTRQEIKSQVEKEKHNTVVTTRDDLTGIFKIGSTVTGLTSGESGTIIKRNLDMGQLFIEGQKDFTSTEIIQTTENSTINTVELVASEYEYNAVHHYEDSDGSWVDINPYSAPSVFYIPITNHERYLEENDALKEIIVIKPDVIDTIFAEFQREMRTKL